MIRRQTWENSNQLNCQYGNLQIEFDSQFVLGTIEKFEFDYQNWFLRHFEIAWLVYLIILDEIKNEWVEFLLSHSGVAYGDRFELETNTFCFLIWIPCFSILDKKILIFGYFISDFDDEAYIVPQKVVFQSCFRIDQYIEWFPAKK
jgi:hypothetical protein